MRPENSVTELGEIEPELIFHYLAQNLKEYNTFNSLYSRIPFMLFVKHGKHQLIVNTLILYTWKVCIVW